jgi:glutamate synthase (NADPH/NADH) small chain
MKLIEEGNFLGAVRVIKEANLLPAVCGRVCPRQNQCEKMCLAGKATNSSPVNIGSLEAFVADFERKKGDIYIPARASLTGKRVAVVGGGPAGITASQELAKFGHDVTIFEALPLLGGVLVYGIPNFRLPKDIVASEIEVLQRLGVKIETNVLIGKTVTIDELLKEEKFDAVFIGTGAGLPKFMGIPGETLCGVYTANEFLSRINLMNAYRFPQYDTPVWCGKKVVVLGSGNTAMDACRSARRLNHGDVKVVYRRTRQESPCLPHEMTHAEEEGVELMWLTQPIRFIGNEQGWLAGIECVKMELTEPGRDGRRSVRPIKDSNFTMECDTAVLGIGASPNELIPKTTSDISTNDRGCIVANFENGETSKPGVFAGGDIISGGSTVIMAMGQGKKAAIAMNDYLIRKAR